MARGVHSQGIWLKLMSSETEIHTLSNGLLEAHVSPVGMTLTSLSRLGGPNLLASADWKTPAPTTVTGTYGSSIADFHANYRGGWHLLFPNSGNACQVAGVDLPFHGEVASQRWTLTGVGAESITAQTVARLPLTISRRISLTGHSIRIEDDIANLSDLTIPYLLGHHPVFPFSPDIRVDLPQSQPVTLHNSGLQSEENVIAKLKRGGTYDGPLLDHDFAGPLNALIALSDMSAPWVAARNVAGQDSVGLVWDGEMMPNMWLWAQSESPDFPWFGRGRFLGLEPQSTPTANGLTFHVDDGKSLALQPGEQKSTWIEAHVFVSDGSPVLSVQESEGPRFDNT